MKSLHFLDQVSLLSDSYGEDIDESESESSGFEADDDLDAFLNEDESMFPPSSAPKSGGILINQLLFVACTITHISLFLVFVRF